MEDLYFIKKRLEDLEHEIFMLRAREQIQNLMGNFAFLQSVARYDEIMETCFSKRTDRSYEDGTSGVYSDDRFMPDLILSWFRNRYGLLEDDSGDIMPQPGWMTINALTSPVIEVAEDGQSADGVWITTGNETKIYPNDSFAMLPSSKNVLLEPCESSHRALWVWLKYSVHFILEENEWRILNMHVYEIFRCPFDEDWVSFAKKRARDDEQLDSMIRFGSENPTHATHPTTEHWQYAPDAALPNFPVVPKPAKR